MLKLEKLSRTAKTKRGPGYRIGETHHNAKLTDHEVELIRALREEGIKIVEIAKKFECTPSNISAITNYRTRTNDRTRKLRVKFLTNEKEGVTMKYKKKWWSEYLNKQDLMELSDKKLEKIGRTHGIELDRRKRKESLVDELYAVL